jgi:hypothetical protein
LSPLIVRCKNSDKLPQWYSPSPNLEISVISSFVLTVNLHSDIKMHAIDNSTNFKLKTEYFELDPAQKYFLSEIADVTYHFDIIQ